MEVKNITKEEEFEKLKLLIKNYYIEELGYDNSKSKLIDMLLNRSKIVRDFSNDDIIDFKRNDPAKFALGLYELDNLIGFVSVNICGDMADLYQIYIKPEYRTYFSAYYKGNKVAVVNLRNSLDNYFKNIGYNELLMRAPKSIDFLRELSIGLGFTEISATDEVEFSLKKI